MKILVFIEHDIMIRHFLHSHVFDELVQRHDVVFVFPEKGNKRVKSDISALNLGGAPARHGGAGVAARALARARAGGER